MCLFAGFLYSLWIIVSVQTFGKSQSCLAFCIYPILSHPVSRSCIFQNTNMTVIKKSACFVLLWELCTQVIITVSQSERESPLKARHSLVFWQKVLKAVKTVFVLVCNVTDVLRCLIFLPGVCESIQRDLMMKAKIICHCIYFLLVVQKVKSEQSSSFLCWTLKERRQKRWVSTSNQNHILLYSVLCVPLILPLLLISQTKTQYQDLLLFSFRYRKPKSI